MLVKEILELTNTSNIPTIAKERLTIGEKPLRETLKAIGCINKAGKKGWIYTGDNPEVLEQSIYDFAPSTPKANKKRTPERKNIPTNEQKGDTMKEQSKENAKEVNTNMRKRASFDLDKQLLKELKIFAINEDKNAYEVVEQAIREYLRGK